MRRGLLDSSALFARLDGDGPDHSRARAFLADQPAVYVVPETVFSEAMTLIKLHAIARRLRIGEVFAFDHHFDQMAAVKLRRVP